MSVHIKEKFTIYQPTILKRKYTNVLHWSIDMNFIELQHNTITGVRTIYINDLLYVSSGFRLIDKGSVHNIDIDNNTYSICILLDKFDFKYEIRRKINLEI